MLSFGHAIKTDVREVLEPFKIGHGDPACVEVNIWNDASIPLQQDIATRTTNIYSFCHTNRICQQYFPQIFHLHTLCVDVVDNMHNEMEIHPFSKNQGTGQLVEPSNGQIVEIVNGKR